MKLFFNFKRAFNLSLNECIASINLLLWSYQNSEIFILSVPFTPNKLFRKDHNTEISHHIIGHISNFQLHLLPNLFETVHFLADRRTVYFGEAYRCWVLQLIHNVSAGCTSYTGSSSSAFTNQLLTG